MPFATLAGDDLDQPAWDPAAFVGAGEATAGHWSTLPFDWRGVPEERLEAAETLAVIGRTLEALPPMQAEVLRLRDVLGWSSEEVRNALDLTDTNQRVLLHRARAKVRAAIDGVPAEREPEREHGHGVQGRRRAAERLPRRDPLPRGACARPRASRWLRRLHHARWSSSA